MKDFKDLIIETISSLNRVLTIKEIATIIGCTPEWVLVTLKRSNYRLMFKFKSSKKIKLKKIEPKRYYIFPNDDVLLQWLVDNIDYHVRGMELLKRNGLPDNIVKEWFVIAKEKQGD